MVIEDDFYREGLEGGGKAAFSIERVQECGGSESGEDFGRNPSSQKDAAGSHGFEGHISGLGSEAIHEDIHGLGAKGAGSEICPFRDDRPGGTLFNFFGDFRNFPSAARIAEEIVNIFDAEAGSNAFGAHVAVAFDEVFQKGDFQFVSRSKIRMAPLAGPHAVADSVPIEASFSEA